MKKEAKYLTINVRKGGAAKTTTAFESADYLEQKGKRVLMVDCDPSMSLTYCYIPLRESEKRVKEENTVLNLFEVNGEVEPIQVSEKIWLIAGSSYLYGKIDEITRGMGRRYLLAWFAKHQDWINENFDYVFFDTHNDGSIIVENAMVLADTIIIPIDVDADSIRTVAEVEHHLEELKALEIHPLTQESFVQAKTMKVGTKVGTEANAKRFTKDFSDLMVADHSFVGWFEHTPIIGTAKVTNEPLSVLKQKSSNKTTTMKQFIARIDDVFYKMYGV
ncbi:MAG: AAA family ATPase [Streptococcaceae bacterium]|nr:AAA family ATPase [Streptococcaceae bacterium]MCL2681418.1 AAA family ATPase [Streptococcaceae bacterium]